MSTVVTETPASSPFTTAWECAKDIAGWLSKDEAGLLFAAANRAPEGGCIVEIGSYRGKSTALLAHTGRDVVAIDPLYVGTGQADNYCVADGDVQALLDVAMRYANVKWLRCEASEVTEEDGIGPVSFLYIDGNHQPPHPLNDFRKFQPHLVPGALIAFHDYADRPAVGQAIRVLEREGTIERMQVASMMWVGRYVNGPPSAKRRVFVGMPFNDKIEPATWDSVLNAMNDQSRVEVHAWRSQWSLLNRSFNDCVCKCHKRGDCDYFLLLHSDIGFKGPWLEKLVDIAESHGFDALHAMSPIKNTDGLTSTAVAYSDDPWKRVRRITTKEAKRLPETFDIGVLKECYDPNAKILLPNTGALLLRYDEWLKDFPGFSSIDRILRKGEAEWEPGVVPEDWNFGFWAAKRGLKVGATTAIKTNHLGRWTYSMEDAWGHEVDPEWAKEQAAA